MHKLGFSYKKPKLVPAKFDANKQEEFKLQYSLLKGNLKNDESILFMDSVHQKYQTRANCDWIKKGENKTLTSFSGWKRKHIIGAINLKNLDLVTTDNPTVNSDYILSAFFDNIPRYEKRLRSLINHNFQTIIHDHFVNSSG